jgi:4-hydroxy-3-polyprenylbenzoate decarboxylase
MPPLVVAITGASGAVYATRLLEVLVNTGHEVHLTISPSGKVVLKQELDISVDLDDFHAYHLLLDAAKSATDTHLEKTRELAGVSTGDSAVRPLPVREPGKVVYHHFQNFMAPIASGSFLTGGMVVCPCSGSTLSGIAHGVGDNLIHRAADVHLKERRKLIVVPRETPLSVIQLENMRRVAEAGAVVLPAMPGWYHGVHSLRDLIDFIVARILDQLGIQHSLMKRWGEGEVEL